jgi:molybdopterin-guanine dinucleotide biosynthesis protein A
MFDGYILIGGRSSRMKTDKFALRLGEATFAERAFAALRKIAGERVYFVCAENQVKETHGLLPVNARAIADSVPGKAAIGGIYTALANSKSEWTAVLACDYPFVNADLFARLAEISDSVKRDVSAIVTLQPGGRVQPLCAIYRTSDCIKAAKQLIESSRVPPARRLAENVSTRFVEFAEIADMPGAESFFINVNTPEEYTEAQKIFRQMPHK